MKVENAQSYNKNIMFSNAICFSKCKYTHIHKTSRTTLCFEKKVHAYDFHDTNVK